MTLSPPVKPDIAIRQDVAHWHADISAQLGEMTTALQADIERVGSRTLGWTVGTMLAGNAAVVALLTLILR
jgi:hypothetical protein